MENKFFISSVPKSGTHLFSSLIESWSGSKVLSVKEKSGYLSFDFSVYEEYNNLVGHYRVPHVLANQSLMNLFKSRKVIILIRDPRDVCNSMLHYVQRGINKNQQDVARQLDGLSFDEQIILIARGVKAADGSVITPNIDKWCSGFVELLNEFENAVLFRYEDFFNIDYFSISIERLLSISAHEARILIKSALASQSKTKRLSGAKPYQWKNLFSAELKEYFKVSHGNLIKKLGYSID